MKKRTRSQKTNMVTEEAEIDDDEEVNTIVYSSNDTKKPVNIDLNRNNIKTKLEDLQDKANDKANALQDKANDETDILVCQWVTRIVSVMRPDGSIRLCGDYKSTINTKAKLDNHPLPNI